MKLRLLRKKCFRNNWALILLLFSQTVAAQSDDCASAQVITISNNGFSTGVFSSTPVPITSATVQPGETFAPAILVAGQSQKSLWFKFTLPTTRNVRVTLGQDGTAITAGDVGFAVYKNATCLPTNAMISNKLTPLPVFGNTTHPCTDPGEYLVQVSAKAAAAGNVVVQVQTALPAAAYDRPAQAYDFGTLGSPNYTRTVDYAVDCQSLEDANEKCTVLANSALYTKSTWHVFKTPAYFDYVSVMLSGTGSTSYFVNQATLQKFGYALYTGDVRSAAISSLTPVDACDSLQTNGYTPDRKIYKCNRLQPNTTYTIQLFHHRDFENNIRLAVTFDGTAPTKAPEPIANLVAASNKLGVLASTAAGVTTSFSDQFGCNALHSLHPCNSLPAAGVRINNLLYNLSTFFTFTLNVTAKLTISGNDIVPPNRHYSSPFLIKIYRQDIGSTCNALDTATLAFPPFLSNAGFTADCVPPGNYTMQVLGRDSLVPATNYYFATLGAPAYVLGMLSDLGKKFNININVRTLQAVNNYALSATNAIDTINRVSNAMAALVNNTNYNSKPDIFGCGNTVRPADTTCAPGNNKVVYREFAVGDSGIVSISTTSYFWNKLYRGDAQQLATAQNAFTFPDRITGLAAVSKCLQYNDCDGNKVCVVPGTYTHLTFGSDAQIGQTVSSSLRFNIINTTYNDPAAPNNMGTLNPGGTLTSAADYFSCKDNAIPINGYMPCTIGGMAATKAIYRQFYLSAPASISINSVYNNCNNASGYLNTLFSGKISDGLSGLTPVAAPYRCFGSVSSPNLCSALDSGWYTVVSYGVGPTYVDPIKNVQVSGGYSSHVGRISQITITAAAGCAGPKYNRPHKAAIDNGTNQPFLIQWAPRLSHTAAYPKTDTVYTLPAENFNCTVDTPFTAHPIVGCNANLTKIAYYVFRTSQPAYIKIDTKNFWGVVYAGNARTDSASFASATPVQSCLQSNGYIQLCNLQPGTYTLAVFATTAQSCTSVQPTIYIDQVATSRFDYAATAYDFAIVPPDSLYYSGKVGDVNPLTSGRAASSDFIYCTTGANQNNPTDPVCGVSYNANVYPARDNAVMFSGTLGQNPARRNLWYTFVAEHGGYVRIKVVNKTPGKTGYVPLYAVYRSDVDGNLPFSTVVANGQVDSTIAQGLTMVVKSGYYPYCFNGYVETNFYRDPCSARKERYYILVENPNSAPNDYSGLQPNSQFEVSILIDSINAIQPKFDHYFQASAIGTNLNAGTYTGVTDNYSCASRGSNDPIVNYSTCANKTIWYKFSTSITGLVRYRALINNISQYGINEVQLFREVKPGDSTTVGLQFLTPATISDGGGTWSQTCVSPGTYYLVLTGCNRLNEYVYPIIKLLEQEGDFCSAPKPALLNGVGTTVASVTVDCHTIGSDYGEFNPTLTCPNGAVKGQYKSSWFRIDVNGNDTLDVTTFLTENTNALPSDIKYRMMKGNCGAMQEQSCVQDALTQDTYKYLAPGSYFVQVFTPVNKNGSPVTGTISLNLSAVKHVDTCAPINNCLSSAAFIPKYDCSVDTAVSFNNLSTYGSAIQYNWNFGHNNSTSTAVSPVFNYPQLNTAQTYTITLTATNTGCAGNSANSSTYTQSITIPARPQIALPADTTLCTPGAPFVLNATTWPGTIYQWQNNSTTPTFTTPASASGTNTYWVKATYNGCVTRDTIVVNRNPNTKLLQTKYLCGADSVLLNSTRTVVDNYQWNTGQTIPSIYAFVEGLYTNQASWKGCVVRDSFQVLKALEPWSKRDTTVCPPFRSFTLNASVPGAISYSWQNGASIPTHAVNGPGTYWVNIWNGTCTKRDTISVLVSALPKDSLSVVTSCAGMGYVLPWGQLATASGIYRDTIRYATGCDSLRRTVTVNFARSTNSSLGAFICPGQTYTLPWGATVASAGIYRDTLRYISGCDSLITTVTVTAKPVSTAVLSATICQGQIYTLPSGVIVTSTGIYTDTLRYRVGGCDSLITTVTLNQKSSIQQAINALICNGDRYTLPSGNVVSMAGIYADTLRYVSGCDSVLTTVTLTHRPVTALSLTAGVCSGQTYTLPSGAVVNTSGTYRDTLRYRAGCDSLVYTIQLSVGTTLRQTRNAAICSGERYTLPSGTIVNTTGVYADTVRYSSGCDSLITTVSITQKSTVQQSLTAVICNGENYSLPSGAVVSATGIYTDTLRYVAGCDSVITTVLLTKRPLETQTLSAVICTGERYTLPSGQTIAATGVYADTLRYTSGCDSLITTVTLTQRPVRAQALNTSICTGQTYTLPSGLTVNTAGTYRDTLRYTAGCDSLISTVTLSVKSLLRQTQAAAICPGQGYTMPSGNVVTGVGSFSDTLRYASGCDSLITTVSLTTKPLVRQSTTATICQGSTYTLPSGTIANAAGNYNDTLRYQAGCDSMIYSILLSVKPVVQQNLRTAICQGQTYTLPSGAIISTAGTYADTVRYTSGCDSLVSTVALTTKPILRSNLLVRICAGSSYSLPSGVTVNSAGVYTDTVRYRAGCDSLISQTTLLVDAVTRRATITTVCPNTTYTLPSGNSISAAGNYSDTLRNTRGCDSLITQLALTIQLKPTFRVSPASGGVCMGENMQLSATGGDSYQWYPAATTSSPNSGTTQVSPTEFTRYKVVITSTACNIVDSLFVPVSIYPKPAINITQSNQIDCMTGITTLRASGGVNYNWSGVGIVRHNGSEVVVASAATSYFIVQATSANGCVATDSVEVKVISGNPDKGFLMPSAFTPNGDGNNDCFGIQHWGRVENLEMTVFNRWGEKVFYTSNSAQCWDGTVAGKPQKTDVYVYIITAKTLCGPVSRKGTVTLVR